MLRHPAIKRQQSGNGMALIDFSEHHEVNPVDVVERMAATHDWSFARASEDEVTLVVAGKWTDYQISFTWMGDIEALHLACAFDLKVPQPRRNEVVELVGKVNEQLWIGHFDLWFKDGLVMFRHALLLTGGVAASRAPSEAGPRGAAAHRRDRRFARAMRVGARDRARHLRTLFPGVPVRGLGRQERDRSARCHHVRDLRRGLRPFHFGYS